MERVERLEKEYDVDIEWRAFDLRPDMPPEGMPSPYTSAERLARSEGIQKMAAEAELKYQSRTWLSNSKKALQATEYAKDKGKFKEFHKGVFEAYFGEAKDIGKIEVIQEVAVKAGLDPVELQKVLEKEIYLDRVEQQFEEARAIGVTGIPTFVFGDKAVVGAYPYQIFQRVMTIVQRDSGIGEDAS